MSTQSKAKPLFYGRSFGAQFWTRSEKLNPRHVVRNPVMFVVEVGSLLTSILAVLAFSGRLRRTHGSFSGSRSGCGSPCSSPTFAEAMAEGRGKAQADTLRKARRDILAKKLRKPSGPPRLRERSREAGLRAGGRRIGACQPADSGRRRRSSMELPRWDESAVTGESAPVIRESGGDRSFGNRRHQGSLRLDCRAHHRQSGRVVSRPLIGPDRSGKRRKTPNEIALEILLAGLTIIFLLTTVTLLPFSVVQRAGRRTGHP
jgi:K+-transporting ATPase ATPase B chain